MPARTQRGSACQSPAMLARRKESFSRPSSSGAENLRVVVVGYAVAGK
jgi:hypothetical protein